MVSVPFAVTAGSMKLLTKVLRVSLRNGYNSNIVKVDIMYKGFFFKLLAYHLVLPYHLQIVPSCHIKIFGYNSTSDFDVLHKN